MEAARLEPPMIEGNTKIAIAGSGSIGCYVGGCLALAGRKVTLLARPRIAGPLREAGLRVSDLDGRDRLLSPAALTVATDPGAALADAGVIVVTVKSGATAGMAALIAAHARPDALVLSLQNGIDNVERLRAGERRVVAGMVPFNVVRSPDGEAPVHVHRASAGVVLVEAGVSGLPELLSVDGLKAATHADMKAVQWGKLLFNLNNALVALSDLTLAAELADRRWRRLLAGQIAEALAAMKANAIRPVAAAGGLPPSLLPAILKLPDWLFRRVAKRTLAIDPRARSSMWDDLEHGRPTEIDELQGVVLRLAARVGTAAPLNGRIAALIKQAERSRQRSPGLAAEAIAAP